MKDMSMMQLVLYVVFLITDLFAWSAASHVALRADLMHVDSGRGDLSKHDLLWRMAARTRARVARRWAPTPRPGGGGYDTGTGMIASVSREDNNADSEYLIHLSIGTPPQPVALTLDTGSDFVWTQCGCRSCFRQPFAALDTTASVTLRNYSCFDRPCAWSGLPLSGCTVNDNHCFYVHSSGDGSFTSGKLSEDTFTFKAPSPGGKSVSVRSLRFGCGMYNAGNFKSNESGIAGFGRGPMSLPSQLNVSRFSYCFTTIGQSMTSPVFLGSYGNLDAQVIGLKPVLSTPFVPSPDGPNKSLYYLSLKGVTIGDRRLPFNATTFALKPDGSGGTIIDSGTGITTFPRAVFRTLRDELVSQVGLPVANVSTDDPESMLCFSTPPSMRNAATAVYVPRLILHLEGADWELPRENNVMAMAGDMLCVVINSARDSGVTIIGNFQQQNMHIAYDLGSNRLYFVPASCNML